MFTHEKCVNITAKKAEIMSLTNETNTDCWYETGPHFSPDSQKLLVTIHTPTKRQ